MNNELYHYNHNHDPRNGQFTSASEARGYKKALNAMDQQYANTAAKVMRDEHAGIRAMGKSRRAEAKGNAEKAKRYSEEAKRLAKSVAYGQAAMKNIDSETWKMIARAVESGYDVNGKTIIRDGERGKTAAMQMIGGLYLSMAHRAATNSEFRGEYVTSLNGRAFSQNPHQIVGKRYKVKRSRTGGTGTVSMR